MNNLFNKSSILFFENLNFKCSYSGTLLLRVDYCRFSLLLFKINLEMFNFLIWVSCNGHDYDLNLRKLFSNSSLKIKSKGFIFSFIMLCRSIMLMTVNTRIVWIWLWSYQCSIDTITSPSFREVNSSNLINLNFLSFWFSTSSFSST